MVLFLSTVGDSAFAHLGQLNGGIMFDILLHSWRSVTLEELHACVHLSRGKPSCQEGLQRDVFPVLQPVITASRHPTEGLAGSNE